MRRSRLAAIAATSLLVILAGCSSSAKKSDSAARHPLAGSLAPAAGAGSFSASAAAESSAPAASPPDAFGDAKNLQPGQGTAPTAATGGSTVVRARVATGSEDIIKIASISIEAKSVDQARNDAVAAAEAHGATVSSEARAGTDRDKNKSATLVFRVLPSDFDALVTALGDLGEVINSTTTSEDVTGQVADIDGRIRAAKDAAEKVRALIGKADKISDLVTLEREYASRDAEIQSMASQLASLKDRAGRSTVTLSIKPKAEPAKAVVPPKKREAGFMGGLKAGWNAFTATTVVFATATGALLPFGVLAAIALLVWWGIRRRRPSAPKPPAEPLAFPAA